MISVIQLMTQFPENESMYVCMYLKEVKEWVTTTLNWECKSSFMVGHKKHSHYNEELGDAVHCYPYCFSFPVSWNHCNKTEKRNMNKTNKNED